MAEVEFGDVKVSGGKLLLIIPLLISILESRIGTHQKLKMVG